MDVMFGTENKEDVSHIISDSINSEFMLYPYEFSDNKITVSAMLVLEEILDDYKVIIDGLEISLN